MDLSQLKPYGSYVLLEGRNAAAGSKHGLEKLEEDIWATIKATATAAKSSVSRRGMLKNDTRSGFRFSGFRFKESRPVVWAQAVAGVLDEINQLVLLIGANDLVAICFSDSSHKHAVSHAARRGDYTEWRTVKRGHLIEALIRGQALLSVWLDGTQRRVSVRPDSKTLAGIDLRDSIDPLGDSSFVAGAARTARGGASLTRSSVWIGPNRSWDTFTDQASRLLTSVASARGAKGWRIHLRSSALAEVRDSTAGLERPYHVELVSPDTPSGRRLRTVVTELQAEFDLTLDEGFTPVKPEDFRAGRPLTKRRRGSRSLS